MVLCCRCKKAETLGNDLCSLCIDRDLSGRENKIASSYKKKVIKDKPCEVCQKIFTPNSSGQKCCKEECRKEKREKSMLKHPWIISSLKSKT